MYTVIVYGVKSLCSIYMLPSLLSKDPTAFLKAVHFSWCCHPNFCHADFCVITLVHTNVPHTRPMHIYIMHTFAAYVGPVHIPNQTFIKVTVQRKLIVVESNINWKLFLSHWTANFFFFILEGTRPLNPPKNGFRALSQNIWLIQINGVPAANNW
jgi:hypothetical protein